MPTLRWPLWLQITLAMSIASVAVAVAAGALMRTIETDFLRDELRRESVRTAQAMTLALGKPAVAGDTLALEAVAERADRRDARIHSVALLDAGGRTVSRWVRDREVTPGEIFYYSFPAEMPGGARGSLVVSWDVGRLVREIAQHVERLQLDVFLVVGVLGAVLVVLVHFLVISPVDALGRGLDQLARGETEARFRLPRLAAAELVRIARSLADLGRYQRELRETQASLEKARRAAEAASEAKGRFLAVMSHEIRTPINGVIGNLEVLADSTLDASDRALVAAAQRAASSLLENINEILDFSRLESGALELEEVEFALEAQLDDIAAGITGLLDPSRVKLVVDFDCALPERVRGDPLRLRQVLTNLLGNAAKFTHDGAIVLRARGAGGGRLALEVADSGIGIAPEQQATLFEPFTQADSSTSRQYGGSGLGLSIVKQLVELMGGAVSLDSAPGRGSTFRVDLPLSPTSPPRDLRVEGSEARRLLLLDDRPQSVDALGAAVASLGFATSPDEALALAPGAHAALLDGLLVTAAGGAAWVDRLRTAAGGRPQVLLRVPPGVRVPEGAAVDAVVLEPVRRDELRAALAARPTAPDDAPPQAAPLTAARVLVVDDNAMNREVALAMLERLGVDADSAGSGDEALERAAAVHYDVVLMDEQMPGMDGRETTRRLRRRSPHRGGGAHRECRRGRGDALPGGRDGRVPEQAGAPRRAAQPAVALDTRAGRAGARRRRRRRLAGC